MIGESVARIHLTGGLQVEGPNGVAVDSDFPGTQGRLAFVALILERHPLSHDVLANLLWPESPPKEWNSALAAVMSKIRSLLLRIGLDGREMVRASNGAYAIALPGGSWVDVEDAYTRLDRAEGAYRSKDPARAITDATVASAILRRPLLEGVFSDWILARRQEQQEALLRCLGLLARAWIDSGNLELAAVIAESAIKIDPFREVNHRLLMEAEWNRNDRGASLRAFARCEQLLADELNVKPSSETLSLADLIRQTG